MRSTTEKVLTAIVEQVEAQGYEVLQAGYIAANAGWLVVQRTRDWETLLTIHYEVHGITLKLAGYSGEGPGAAVWHGGDAELCVRRLTQVPQFLEWLHDRLPRRVPK